MKEIITLLFWGLFPFLLTSLSATGFVDPSSSFIEGMFTQEGINLPARFQRKMIPAPKGSPSWIRERLDKKELMVTMRTPYNAEQVQSSWFPLVDRNPQTFVDIYHCGEEDFQKATHKVFSGSKIEVKVLNQN